MLFKSPWAVAALAFGGITCASPVSDKMDKRSTVWEDGIKYTKFEHRATGTTIKYVTNSGICETTPGVNQYSGYITVGTNMNMWFWFFEARNSSATAPLATWFNGGPGCSSMIGLFQENGPCQFYNGATEPSLNPYSWNNYANMLYIDQPIGTGFSYGTDPVVSTVTAAPYVWTLLQAFFTNFPQYENRDFGIFTESYGGHFGPEFADYFESQNAAVAAGTVTGQKVNLVALGVNNGWFDPKISYKAYVDYSYSNPYKQLISASQHTSYMNTYTSQCVPALATCASSGTNSACSNAENTCVSGIENAIINAAPDFDVYDIRAPSNDPNPPESYTSYLAQTAVMTAIGAKSTYVECSNSAGTGFTNTGDDARSFLPQLSDVVKSGVTTLIWAGDADWICNWLGGQASAEAITWSGQAAFTAQAMVNYTVNGVAGGTFKTLNNLSFMRVFAAGHEVPFYSPKVALQAFIQTMQKKPLSST